MTPHSFIFRCTSASISLPLAAVVTPIFPGVSVTCVWVFGRDILHVSVSGRARRAAKGARRD